MILTVKKQLNFSIGEGYLDIDMQVQAGTLVAISGPSGSGKTTLLRLIAGLSTAESGYIHVNGEDWLDTTTKINRPPQKRSIGYVFQNYALFPNMTVRQNLTFALEKNQSTAIIEELIHTMELDNLIHQYPATLSGGQQQRVALARALVQKPQVLLLDEPLAALDEAMRNRLQDYILKIHQQYELITLLVSHDTQEILKMADKVLVLEAGKIIKSGTPQTIFAASTIKKEYQLSGTVIKIQDKGNNYVVSVKIGDNSVEVERKKKGQTDLVIGDKVIVSTMALNPVLNKQ